MKHVVIVVVAVLGLLSFAAGLDYLIFRGLELGAVTAPRPNDVPNRTIPQAWDDATRQEFHTKSQGTRFLPKSWLLALQEPSPDPIFPGVKLASREYLSRFGFTYDAKSELPIGFATETWKDGVDYADPKIRPGIEMVGLTCAACHTGRLDFDLRRNGKLSVLIEGGSSMINLGGFQDAVGQALFWTSKYRLKSFIRQVQKYEREQSGGKPPALDVEADAKQIEKDVKQYIESGLARRDYAKEHKLYPVEAGFARTDALGLIGNRVFGPLNEENQSVADAPVNFPHLWDTSWFDWVQYNGSIRPPLARNIGEALGVGAAVKLGATPDESETTVNFENLFWIENWLGGDKPFVPRSDDKTSCKTGLQPPRWEDLRAAVAEVGGLADPTENEAMTIKEDLRALGETLYKVSCKGCHLPPREELEASYRQDPANSNEFWENDPRTGGRFLRLKVIDLDEIGTDPNQAVNFYRRFSGVPNPRIGQNTPAGSYARSGAVQTISASEGLYRITSFLRAKEFRKRGLFDSAFDAQRHAADRLRTFPIKSGPGIEEIKLDVENDILSRKSMDDVIRPNLGYKARPLDGVWATPPFLHNGSVPNLDQVLSPVSKRDVKFYLGTTRFDPVKVGYKTEHFYGAFLMDTTLLGNRNTGHEFRNLTLEEFEEALFDDASRFDPDDPPSLDRRWDLVLDADVSTLTEDERRQAERDRTEKILCEVRTGERKLVRNPKFIGKRGVLGPEFTTRQRRALIEYLKSL